jgi:hypothetical protein
MVSDTGWETSPALFNPIGNRSIHRKARKGPRDREAPDLVIAGKMVAGSGILEARRLLELAFFLSLVVDSGLLGCGRLGLFLPLLRVFAVLLLQLRLELHVLGYDLHLRPGLPLGARSPILLRPADHAHAPGPPTVTPRRPGQKRPGGDLEKRDLHTGWMRARSCRPRPPSGCTSAQDLTTTWDHLFLLAGPELIFWDSLSRFLQPDEHSIAKALRPDRGPYLSCSKLRDMVFSI